MSDTSRGPIEPVPAVGASRRALPVRHPAEPPAQAAQPHTAQAQSEDVPAATASAYAQFVVNPDTHDVVIRVRDSATDEIIREYPSSEIEQMNKYLVQYSALARRRAAKQN